MSGVGTNRLNGIGTLPEPGFNFSILAGTGTAVPGLSDYSENDLKVPIML